MNTQQITQNTIEEDEIDLRELWETIKQGKLIILFTVVIVVAMTLVFVLKTPNSYKSEAILIPTSTGGGPSLGGLGGLAAMAGVNIGGGSMTPDIAYNSLLKDYDFMKNFIIKNHIYEYYNRDDFDKDYVFPFGFRGIYNMFKSSKSVNKNIDKEAAIFGLTKRLQGAYKITADKTSGLITVSYMDKDKKITAKMVNNFLRDASSYLVENGLYNINNRLKYFEKVMSRVDTIELRQSLSQIISQIFQEKVMMKSKYYYQCDLLVAPKEAYIKDKTKPKRALTLIVALITSLILGVFIVFLRNFISK